MIKTEDLKTSVIFGNENKANISISSDKNKLILQLLKNEKKVGDKVEDEDKIDLPKVECEFFTKGSIDAMIKHLESIRKKLPLPVVDYQLALAC